MADPKNSGDARPYPRPAINDDFAPLYEGFEARTLLVQQCSSCGHVRYPPSPMCPKCNSLDHDQIASKGKGRIFSYTVHHYPPIDPFPTPHGVLLVDMDEGFRFVAALEGDHADIEIGKRVMLEFRQYEDDLTLPVFVSDDEEAGA